MRGITQGCAFLISGQRGLFSLNPLIRLWKHQRTLTLAKLKRIDENEKNIQPNSHNLQIYTCFV